MTQSIHFTRLKNRGKIIISGADSRSFLQGLISNDIHLLDRMPMIYSCLLTPQGKFLYDFFISVENDALILDCEGGERLQALTKLLSIYKLRANISIEMHDGLEVYAILSTQNDKNISIGYPDPRHNKMGCRSYTLPALGNEVPFDVWDEHRIKLCVPDGSRDMIPNQSTLLECGIDKLNGVSYDKGCYMGQELTARTHYRGLIKKHLYVIQGKNLPPHGTALEIDGQVVGEMRSACNGYGLALLKDERASYFTEAERF